MPNGKQVSIYPAQKRHAVLLFPKIKAMALHKDGTGDVLRLSPLSGWTP
jgi:hypothetical protein